MKKIPKIMTLIVIEKCFQMEQIIKVEYQLADRGDLIAFMYKNNFEHLKLLLTLNKFHTLALSMNEFEIEKEIKYKIGQDEYFYFNKESLNKLINLYQQTITNKKALILSLKDKIDEMRAR
jgi:hypothetical protein